jgi:hypothetical protein
MTKGMHSNPTTTRISAPLLTFWQFVGAINDDGGWMVQPPSTTEVSMTATHRCLLRRIVVILTIKVKIILIRR